MNAAETASILGTSVVEPCKHASMTRPETVHRALMKAGPDFPCAACLASAQKGKKGKKKNKGRKAMQHKVMSSTSPTSSQYAPDDMEQRLEGLWLCLTCGKISCGRNSPDRHSLVHYASNRKHAIVMEISSLSVWCYACDADVRVEACDSLLECQASVQRLVFRQGEVIVAAAQGTTATKQRRSTDALMAVASSVAAAAVPSSARANGVRGLANMGNTCFFNSTMQVLTQAAPLREALVSASSAEQEAAGDVTGALRRFYTQMWRPGSGTLVPRDLFSMVCRKAPRFRSYQQQDAQELLRQLLENVREEEQHRLLGGRKPKPGEKLPATLIDDVFGGKLASTVVCLSCHQPSIVTESFLDLSLPIPLSAADRLGSRTSSMRSGSSARRRASRSSAGAAAVASMSTLAPATETEVRRRAAMSRLLDSLSGLRIGRRRRLSTGGAAALRKRSHSAAPAPGVRDATGRRSSSRWRSLSPMRQRSASDVTASVPAARTGGGGGGVSALSPVPEEDAQQRPEPDSVYACLAEFTQPERLEGPNAYGCEHCGKEQAASEGREYDAKQPVYRTALKRFLLHQAPVILTIHLKRFEATMRGFRKIGKHVSFPTVLDMTPYCTDAAIEAADNGTGKVLYRLFGVVVHGGSLGGGHYIANVLERRSMTHWNYFSDSRHSRTTLAEVLRSNAYLLFYQRLGTA